MKGTCVFAGLNYDNNGLASGSQDSGAGRQSKEINNLSNKQFDASSRLTAEQAAIILPVFISPCMSLRSRTIIMVTLTPKSARVMLSQSVAKEINFFIVILMLECIILQNASFLFTVSQFTM
jgi:hypothetical protein